MVLTLYCIWCVRASIIQGQQSSPKPKNKEREREREIVTLDRDMKESLMIYVCSCRRDIEELCITGAFVDVGISLPTEFLLPSTNQIK